MFTARADTRCSPAHGTGIAPACGASAPFERARREARRLLASGAPATPIAAFRLHEVKSIRGEVLDLGGAQISAPRLARLPGRVTAIAAAACTLGAALESRISALFSARRPLLALALDDLASERLFAASERLCARIAREARRRGLRAGAQENPGDSGMGLESQGTVLALAGVAGETLSVNARGMLQPLKSMAFVVPLGPDLAGGVSTPRCVSCASRQGCRLRPR